MRLNAPDFAVKVAGLDHIQLSFQDSTRELNDFLSSTRTFELKQKIAATIKSLGYPMVMTALSGMNSTNDGTRP